MASIDEVLNSVKDDASKLIKDQLKDLLTIARQDADSIVKETGKKIEDWLVMRAQGKLSDAELESLLYSRDQLLRQYKNTLEIQARARIEKIAVGLINLILDKVL
jgi:hypothetical protein